MYLARRSPISFLPRVYSQPVNEMVVGPFAVHETFLGHWNHMFLEPVGTRHQIVVNLHTEHSIKQAIASTQKHRGTNLGLDEPNVLKPLYMFGLPLEESGVQAIHSFPSFENCS